MQRVKLTMEDVDRALRMAGRPVPPVRCPERAGEGAGNGHGPAEEPLTRGTGSGREPDLVRLRDAKRTSVHWLWEGRIPLGKITVLAGDPGLGKSFITLDIAARVSTGSPWPDALDAPQRARCVVLLSAEDDIGDTILPRLEAARADLSRIAALRGIRGGPGDSAAPFRLDRDLPQLEQALGRLGDVGLVIIDPITAYVGGVDMNSNPEVRALLAPLADLAMRRHVAVLLVTHLNKGANTKGIYRISGSLALPAAARAAMLVVRDAEDGSRRLLLPTKLNVGRAAQGLAYRIGDDAGGDAVVQWEDQPVVMTADEAVRAEEAPGESGGAVEEAAAFLRELLKDGPVAARRAVEEAGQLGIVERTLQRARARLGVVSRRIGQEWVLSMGEGRQDRQPPPVAGLAALALSPPDR